MRGGTLTPHSQTIDTWSFGCVLSAVATWVVLGPQAYENYGKRRKFAVSDLRRRAQDSASRVSVPSCDDSFHDGQTVLPAVSEWHDYLRNSCRRADTMTPLVLDLVDKEMLLARPDDRLTLEQLCEKLDDILALARHKYQKAIDSGNLKEVTPKTLEALLKLDEDAPPLPEALSSSITANTLPTVSETNHSHQLAALAGRVRKSERFDKIVVARTANRQGVIRDGLGKSPVPAFADRIMPESPEPGPLDFTNSTPGIRLITDELVSTPTTVSPVAVPGARGQQQPQDSSRRPKRPKTPDRIVTTTADTDERRQDTMLHNPYRPRNHIQSMPHNDNDGSSSHNNQREMSPRSSRALEFNSFPISRVTATSANHNTSETAAELPTPDPHRYSQPYSQGKYLSLTGTDTNFMDHRDGHIPIQEHTHRQYLQPDEGDRNASVSTQQSDPESTAIYREYRRLKEEWDGKRGSWQNFLGTRRVPEDARLKRFISNRDIVGIY